MSKTRQAEVLSLDTTKQKEVVKQTKKLKQQIKDGTISYRDARKAQKLNAQQQRGLLFISHLPHGFYENELKKYFKQFGRVTNVKVCRSSRTGRSKGYGYVEFGYPEVAKIAAEAMNNYLMFKKRVTAEFVPYEKRPTGLFIGKSATATHFSSKIRRQKQYQTNLKIDEKTHMERTRSRISKLNKKLEKLEKLGIKTRYTPENIAVIKEEMTHPQKNQLVSNIYEGDHHDSEIEIKLPIKRSKKSITATTSGSLTESGPAKKGMPNKMKSTISLRSNKSTVKEPNKVDVATSSPVLPVTAKKNKSKGINKRSKKLQPLDCETVKKIARELIRKRGDSLLNYPLNTTGKPKMKFTKK